MAVPGSNNDILKLIRPGLADFAGYSAATSPETLEGKVDVPVKSIIKLDANENPYGCSPRVNRALADYANYHVYPDDGQASLRRMLADYYGVDAANVVASSGSNRLIDLILRLLLEPGDEVINCVPTFGVYAFSTRLCGGRLVEVPRTTDFTVDVAAIHAAITSRTKMIFIASPNNPTGTPVLRSDILELLATGVPLMVDEAYYEFNGETVAPLVSEHRNLSVLRSFSKWAGLAGLRIGYGLFPAAVADLLLRTKIPYNLNAAAIVAVTESLADIDYLNSRVTAIIEERGRLFAKLSRIDWLRVVPSSANFILCQVLRGHAAELHQQLRQRGILIRYFAEPRLDNYIRISVGRPEDTDAVVRMLREIGG